jgi:hypothetical protein
MTLTVTHGFVSANADDPTDAAAGDVLPSHWNANHTITGSSDLEVDGTAVTSGADGGIFFELSGKFSQDAASFSWNDTTKQLIVGTNDPTIFEQFGFTGPSFGQPNLGVNGQSGNYFTAIFASDFQQGVNIGLFPNSPIAGTPIAGYWNMWVAAAISPGDGTPMGFNFITSASDVNPLTLTTDNFVIVDNTLLLMRSENAFNDKFLQVALKGQDPTAGVGNYWTLSFPPDPGTNGYVLQTDGTGVTSWVPSGAATLAIGGAITGGTDGQVLFEDAGALAQDAGFLWDNTNKRLAIGSNTSFTSPSLIVGSTNTAATSFVIDAVGGGGHRLEFQSSGSANGLGPGRFVIYDETLVTVGSVFIVLGADIHGMLPQQVLAWNEDNQFQFGTYDLGFSRLGAAVAGLGNGTAGDFSGTLKLTNLHVEPVAIASLPGSPAAGDIATVNDGDASLTNGQTPVNGGGGATEYLVAYLNGGWRIVV